jgi:hypothetical protein
MDAVILLAIIYGQMRRYSDSLWPAVLMFPAKMGYNYLHNPIIPRQSTGILPLNIQCSHLRRHAQGKMVHA